MSEQFKQGFAEVLVPMMEAKFTLFQMQLKRVFGHATKLLKPGFGEAPKRLHTVAICSALPEFVFSMLHAKELVVAYIDQATLPFLKRAHSGTGWGRRASDIPVNPIQPQLPGPGNRQRAGTDPAANLLPAGTVHQARPE